MRRARNCGNRARCSRDTLPVSGLRAVSVTSPDASYGDVLDDITEAGNGDGGHVGASAG